MISQIEYTYGLGEKLLKTKILTLLIGLLWGSVAWGTSLTTTVTQDLLFGTITPDPNGGTVERYNGIINISGNASFSGLSQDAQMQFSLDTCDEATNASCGYEATPSTITLTGPGDDITLNTFQPSSSTTGYFATSPIYQNMGARITYGTNQTAGTYTGSIPVNIQPLPSGTSEIISVPVNVTIAPPPITIAETTPLNFGQVVPDTNGGSISITSGGSVVNTTGSATILGGSTAGVLQINGAPNTQVFTSPVSDITLSGPSANVTLENISPVLSNPTLDATGSHDMTITGRISYPTDVQPGTYSGSYNITINY